MAEIYRSFEGKLGVEQQTGFVVSDGASGGITIECLYVFNDTPDVKYFVPEGNKDFNVDTDWSKYESLRDMLEDLIEHSDVKVFDHDANAYVKAW